MLERVFGKHGHAITLTSPWLPGVVLNYTAWEQITDDIDDARIYGGIHFRFDQEAGAHQGRQVGKYILRHHLRAMHGETDAAMTIEPGRSRPSPRAGRGAAARAARLVSGRAARVDGAVGGTAGPPIRSPGRAAGPPPARPPMHHEDWRGLPAPRRRPAMAAAGSAA